MLLSKPDSYEKKGKLQASTSHKQNIGKNNLAMCIERILNHEQAGLILRIHHWFNIKKKKKEVWGWIFLMIQWLGILLPMQGTWVQSLVWEYSTCLWATKPVGHNY